MLAQIPSLASIPGLQAALNAKAALTGATFTGAVSLGNGTLAASAPVFTASQTWNNAAVDFTALLVNVTDTASASTAKLLDLQVNGVSKFSVGKTGTLQFSSGGLTVIPNYSGGGRISIGVPGANRIFCDMSTRFQTTSAMLIGWTPSATEAAELDMDTALARRAAGVIEFNNGTAGVFRDWKARRGTFTEYLEGPVSFEPAAPASGVRLWVNYTGGRSLLMARFATGASQVVANEP